MKKLLVIALCTLMFSISFALIVGCTSNYSSVAPAKVSASDSTPLSQMNDEQLTRKVEYWQLKVESTGLVDYANSFATITQMYQNEQLRRELKALNEKIK